MIDGQILSRLIAFGKERDIESAQAVERLSDLQARDHINRLHWQDWEMVTSSLPTEDVVALAKALTVAEKWFKWTGGSVAGAIWVFRELLRRDINLGRGVAEWVLARTDNPWLAGTVANFDNPFFGSMWFGARSFKEHQQQLAEYLGRKEAMAAEIQAEQERARSRRVQRIASHRARAEEKRRWVTDFMALDPTERLRHISWDKEHSIDFYPPQCAEVGVEVLAGLDLQTIHRLLERLRTRRKGPWRNLYVIAKQRSQCS